MSLYSDYLKEREGVSTLEVEDGFATYRFNGEQECYIVDIYVRPSLRKAGLAASLANQICGVAKKQGCKFLTGSVDTSTKGVTESMSVLLAYGMKFLRQEDTMIYFYKEIL